MSQKEIKRGRGITGWVVAGILLCVCVSVLVLGGCIYLMDGFARLGPVPTTPPEELLLDPSAFPPEWYSVTEPADRTSRVTSSLFNRYYDATGQWYDYPGSVQSAFHAVARYSSIERAQRNYLQLVEMSSPADYQWHNPLAEELLELGADEHYFACLLGYGSELGEQIVNCTSIARYGSYVTVLDVHIDPPHMTYNGILRLLQAIDDKFTDAH
jgi:hypothetical protein